MDTDDGVAKSLRDVLQNPDRFSFSDALYTAASSAPDLEDEVIVWDVDDVTDEDSDLPDAVASRGFRYVIGMQTLQGIVANARAQRPEATVADRYEAFRFYLRNDAFIVW